MKLIPQYLYLFNICLVATFLQSCNQSPSKAELPIPGGITLAIHESGGKAALNDSIQISDHWQLSSVGRSHGWMRKLSVDEQKELVQLLHSFAELHSYSEGETSTLIVAKGTGDGHGTPEDAAALSYLVKKFIGARRVASR